MKKIIAGLLCLILCASSTAAAADRLPVKWKLSDIYASEDEFWADVERAGNLAEGMEAYRGRLKDPAVMAEFDNYTTRCSQILDRLRLYSGLNYSLNPTDARALRLSAAANQTQTDFMQSFAFFDEEVAEWTYEERVAVFSSPALKDYAYGYRQYLEEDYTPLTEQASQAMSLTGAAMSGVQTVYDTLSYVELPAGSFQTPAGETVPLTDENYGTYLGIAYYAGNRDEVLRVENAYYQRYGDLIHTFAALLQTKLAYTWAAVRLEGYDSARAGMLDVYDVPPEVYDLLVDAFEEQGVPVLWEYERSCLDALGLEEGEGILSDVIFGLSDYYRVYTYDQAVDTVRTALSPLGEEYLEHFDRMTASGHIDVYPAANKETGSYETSCSSPDVLPYMLLNFTGDNTSLSTFAHEMGHAVYDMMAAENQWYGYAAPTIFTQEVASITNEILFHLYMIDHARSEDERLYYLEQLIIQYLNSFFYQMILAEFEDEAYKMVESGGALEAEKVSQLYYDINQRVFGPVRLSDNSRYEWAGISHIFQSPYYVYQYATSIVYATRIATAIYEGREGAVESYMDFLKAGNSMGPRELLNLVDVDIASADTYEGALDALSQWIEEYKEIVG